MQAPATEFSKARPWVYSPTSFVLFGFGAGGLDDFGPLRFFAIDVLAILLRRARQWLGTFDGETLSHLITFQGGVELFVEPVDDGTRRAGRRDETITKHRFESGQALLRNGRHVGQQCRTLRAGHRQHTQGAGFGLFMGRRNWRESHWDMSSQQINDRRSSAFVRNVRELDAGHGRKIFAADVTDGADPGRTEIDLA